MVDNSYIASHKIARDDIGHNFPEYKRFEGVTPKMFTKIAFYLPLGVQNPWLQEYFVVSPGKVMSLASDGYLVPSGYRIQIEEAFTEGDVAAINNVITYTATDVTQVVKNKNGTTVTASEKVIASMIETGVGVTGATGDEAYEISPPVGVCHYPILRNSDNNSRPYGHTTAKAVSSPTDDRLHNWKLQERVNVLCDYVLEYPVITEATADAGTPWPGMGVYNSVNGVPKPGFFVTFDARSDLVLADQSTIKWGDVVGQILRVDTVFPKALLDRVHTRYASGFATGLTALDQMPGSATDGLPDLITYAGGSSTLGTCYVNLMRT